MDFHGIWFVLFFHSCILKSGAVTSPSPYSYLFTKGFSVLKWDYYLLELLSLLVACIICFYSSEMNFY